MLTLSDSEKLLYLIAGFGTLQGILLAGLIYFHKKSDKSVNIFLALYIFFISLVMTLPFLARTAFWRYSYFHVSAPLIVGPLLYFYLRSFKETITWKKAFPHFIFFFIFLICAYFNMSFIAREFPDSKAIPSGALHYTTTIVLNYVRGGQSIVYYFLARRALISYQRSIKQLFSQTSKIDLQWARLLVNGFLLITFTELAGVSFIIRFPEYLHTVLVLIMSIVTPYIYMVTYKGMMQPAIWQKAGTNKMEIEEEIKQAEKIETQKSKIETPRQPKPIIVDDKMQELVGKIVNLMEKDKLYQETELTLQDLADKLQIPSYQVSLAINDGMKKNFYDLINNYRVEEAKRLLLDPKNSNYTILSVGFEAGFNSKTTFNTVFKKFTGLTPTAYRIEKKSMHVVA